MRIEDVEMFALNFLQMFGGPEGLVYHVCIIPLHKIQVTISRTCWIEIGRYSVGRWECWAAFIQSYCLYQTRLRSLPTAFFRGLQRGSLGAYLFCSMILLLVRADETGWGSWQVLVGQLEVQGGVQVEQKEGGVSSEVG